MKKLLSILSAGIILGSCSSPLSDVAITDPGLISPKFTLQHNNTDNGVNSTITACLMDKNSAYIELLEGNVQLNNEQMSFNVTCYNTGEAIKENNDYDFVVTLADSVEYTSSVTTPQFVDKLKYPGKVKKDEDIELSWNGGTEKTKVLYQVKDTTNNWIILFEQDVTGDNVAIRNIDYPNYNIELGQVVLSRTSEGNVAEGFNGGACKAVCTYSRTIKIK